VGPRHARPKRRLRVAPVPPQAANLTGPARDADGMAGRDGGTGALIEPRNMDQRAEGACRGGQSPDKATHPMWVETENASHTEKLTLPLSLASPARRPCPARGRSHERQCQGPRTEILSIRGNVTHGLRVCQAQTLLLVSPASIPFQMNEKRPGGVWMHAGAVRTDRKISQRNRSIA